ncbi:MAG: PKR inhibitor (translation regulation), partial [Planctomycetota bacterium]
MLSCFLFGFSAEAAPPADLLDQSANSGIATDGAQAPETKDDDPVEEPRPAKPGQEDLNEAIVKRIDADTPAQLEGVAALLESAIGKGLTDENVAFAEKMLGSIRFQQAQEIAGGLSQLRGRRARRAFDEVLDLLDDAVRLDDELVEAHLMIAKLNLLPGGDRDAVRAATTRGIELLEDEPIKLSQVYVLRSLTQSDSKTKRADLDKAVEIDEDNFEARRFRARLALEMNDIEVAMVDIEKVLLKNPTDEVLAGEVVQELVERDRVKEALGLTTKLLEAQPSEGVYRMRAILHRANGELEEAMSDLDKAISLAPK